MISTELTSSKTEFNIRFKPRSIFEITSSTIEISQIINVSFKNIKTLTHVLPKYLYVVEEEVNAEYKGDFDAQTLVTLGSRSYHSLGHGPSPSLRQIDKTALEDRVSVMLDKNKAAKNGHLIWNIPMLIFNAQSYISSIDSAEDPTKIIPLKYTSETVPSIKLTVGKLKLELIKKINVVQKYILKDGILTMIKHGSIQFQFDLNCIGFNKKE